MNALSEKVQNLACRAYAKTHFSQDLVALYFSRTMMRISFGMLGIFMPIFFFKEFGYDIQIVIAIYLALFGLTLLLTPISAKFLNILGTRKMIVLGIVFATAAIGSLYYFPENPGTVTILYIIFISIYKVLYWIPYHVDFANALDKTMRGRQLAILRNFASLVLIAVPVFGGILITTAGFSYVFVVATIIMLISLTPLWFMYNTYERYSWGYLDTFVHLFSKKNRPLFLAHASGGVQGITTTVFWPIYIFMLLDERFTVLGAIASLTIIFVIVLRAVVGKLFDTWSHKRILLVGVIMASTGWITKIFVQTPFGIFAADSYHYFGRTVNSLSFDATTYEQLVDNGTYIDEYTALKEMSLAIGRILMLILMAVLLYTFDIRVAFIIAAVVALFMLIINRKVSVR